MPTKQENMTKRKSVGGNKQHFKNAAPLQQNVTSPKVHDTTEEDTSSFLSPGHFEESEDMHETEGAMGYEDRGGSGVPLTEEYKQQVRPFIDLIDKLRAYGLDQDVQLPAVAVIGDQSAGKSSALEAISGIQLPRGKGIVTRCPLVLRLKSTVEVQGQWKAKIQYTDSEGEKIDKDIDEPEEVTKHVEEAQDAIAGTKKGISKELITLDVVSGDVPDLTLIDLPGITRIAVEGQPADIGEQIKDLIMRRIKQQETIILAVVPANVDIATNEALQLAKTFDEHGDRTLGVVTKPDLIDRGTESELIAVLNNERYRLEKGYTCVKCRGQERLDQGQTLQMALDEEDKFFERKEHFRQVDQTMLGVRNLSRKLTYELVEQIKKTIPALKEEVEKKTEETRRRLEKLGAGLPENKAHMIAYILRMLTSYTDRVKHECEHGLFKKARDMYTDLMMNISEKSPDHTDELFMRKVKAECVKSRGNELPQFMNYEVFRGLVIGIIDRYILENNTCVDKVNKMMDKAITEMVDEEFAHLPRLAGEIKKKVTGVRQKAHDTCRHRLDEIIAMEKLVFTQDRIYNKDLESMRETQQGAENGDQKAAEVPKPSYSRGIQFIASIQCARWFDDVDRDYEETIAKNMLEMIKAFVEVSNRRMVDYVPLTISLHLIENLWKNIRDEVPAMVTEPEFMQFVHEDNRIVTERNKLQKTLERLELAHSELITF